MVLTPAVLRQVAEVELGVEVDILKMSFTQFFVILSVTSTHQLSIFDTIAVKKSKWFEAFE